MIEDVGELLAIEEFNAEGHGRKIRHPWMLRANVPLRPPWADLDCCGDLGRWALLK
jgi:hypothetical protein